MKMPTIRRVIVIMTLALAPALVIAQAYPSKPITIIVPSTPGGVLDMGARAVQQSLSEDLKQPIVIENKPGGGGHIAASQVAKSAPDGYTILCSSGSILVSGVTRNLTYAPMTDLIPVVRLSGGPFFLVVSSNSSFKTLSDLVAYGRANPGKVFYASSSVGNSTHIGAEMFNSMVGMRATHVPYKGNAPALTDVVGERVHFMLDSRVSINPLVQGGKLRPLAVTSRERAKEYPDVPTIGELVKGYEIEGWIGMFVPKETKPEIVNRLASALKDAVADPAIARRLRDSSGDATFLGPAEARKFMLEDHERIFKVVREANITAD